MIETETLLVNCPRCGVWPMAASLPKSNVGHAQIRFRCPSCKYEERGTLRRANKPPTPLGAAPARSRLT